MKVTGKIKPLRDAVLVSNMEFGEQKSKSGIVLRSDNGKTQGIYPRWGQVWAIGDDQKDVSVGEWVLIEHGRWTRTIKVEEDTGNVIEIRMVDNAAIMVASNTRPSDIRAEL